MNLIKRYEFWVVVVVIAGGVFGFLNLPSRVEKVETKVEEHDEHIQKVTNTFDMYMMEQRTIQSEQDKREKLMLDIIEKVAK